MERPEDRPEDRDDALLGRVRNQLDRADASNDEVRLETLETLRRDLEAELDSSLENDASRR